MLEKWQWRNTHRQIRWIRLDSNGRFLRQGGDTAINEYGFSRFFSVSGSSAPIWIVLYRELVYHRKATCQNHCGEVLAGRNCTTFRHDCLPLSVVFGFLVAETMTKATLYPIYR